MRIILSHHKDPYEPISIMECHKGFECCSCVTGTRSKNRQPPQTFFPFFQANGPSMLSLAVGSFEPLALISRCFCVCCKADSDVTKGNHVVRSPFHARLAIFFGVVCNQVSLSVPQQWIPDNSEQMQGQSTHLCWDTLKVKFLRIGLGFSADFSEKTPRKGS